LIRKDVVIAVLATFCLTSTLFMITTSKSQSGVGEYNPWADYNGDGTIDIFDIVPGAVSFGATSTDTTKNVTVTNWPTQQKTFPENLLLRGTYHNGYEYTHNLIDNTTPYANQNFKYGYGSRYDYDISSVTLTTTHSYIYNQTFVYDKFPLRSYKILGRPAVSITYNITNSPAASFNIHLYAELGVVSTTNDWTTIAVLSELVNGFSGVFTDYQIPKYLTNHIGSPGFTVYPNERIAVRVIFYGYTNSGTANLTLEVCFNMNSDEFLVDIPIVESP